MIIIFVFISLFCFRVGAVESNDKNMSLEEQAVICLNDSDELFHELIMENFSVQRVNDSLIEATHLFDAQTVLKEGRKNHDFSLVLPFCEEISLIKKSAFEARDEVTALLKFYNESITPEMNASEVEETLSEIDNEMISERYEKVKPLVSKAYEQIINIKSIQTTLNLFYKSTTRDLKEFFYKNWIYILSGVLLLFILFWIYKKTIRRWYIKRKISNLELRKKILQGLISQTQRDYFQTGKIPEGAYNTRTKKFAELIRDIDQSLPLLKEELFKIADKLKQKVFPGKEEDTKKIKEKETKKNKK